KKHSENTKSLSQMKWNSEEKEYYKLNGKHSSSSKNSIENNSGEKWKLESELHVKPLKQGIASQRSDLRNDLKILDEEIEEIQKSLEKVTRRLEKDTTLTGRTSHST